MLKPKRWPKPSRMPSGRGADSCGSLIADPVRWGQRQIDPHRQSIGDHLESLQNQVGRGLPGCRMIGDNTVLAKYLSQVNKKGNSEMATAKKMAPKAAATPKKVTAPAKVVKPVAKAAVKKAPVSKTAKAVAKLGASIAKLTERKDKINAEIKVLRDQRAALKVVPVAPAPAAPKAKAAPKAAPKAAAPKKAAKPTAKK